jgi:hypothetical protein
VSSNDLRREPPFRRRNEVQHWGPFKTNELVLRSPLLVPSTYDDDVDPTQLYSPDPQGTWYAMLAGNTQLLLNGSAVTTGPGNFALAMVTAGLHDYRVPAPILDLFVNNTSRRFYQRFHHGHIIRDTNSQDSADELYAASPSFLITAGGHPTECAYRPVVLGQDSPICPDPTDLGLAMPTTFMPTASGGPVELTLDRYIQIGLLSGGSGPDKHNMCVAPDFACGCSIYLPPQFDPDKTPHDARVIRDGNWTFINRGSNGSTPGYYLAVHRILRVGQQMCGVLEAYDTMLGRSFAPLSFEAFQQTVKATNPSVNLQLGSNQVSTYTTVSGQHIAFTLTPKSEIISTDAEDEPLGLAEKFVHGTIMNSQQGSGFIVIKNPARREQITLDMRDPFHPTRISETGRVERAGADIHQEVWVDFHSPNGILEEGDFYHPAKSLAKAQQIVAPGGTVKIMSGSKVEPIELRQPMIVMAVPGAATISK